MKLYGTLTSPYVRKVRAFLLEKGLNCEFIVESPTDNAGNIGRFNPLGKIPILINDGGEVLFDSIMILEYLDSLGGTALIPPPSPERWEAQRWHALGHGIIDAVVARLLETRRPAGKQDAAFIARQEGKVAATLRYAEDHIGTRQFLIGDRCTVADIVLGVALDHVDFRYAHDWRSTAPRLTAWMSHIGARPSLIETRPPRG